MTPWKKLASRLLRILAGVPIVSLLAGGLLLLALGVTRRPVLPLSSAAWSGRSLKRRLVMLEHHSPSGRMNARWIVIPAALCAGLVGLTAAAPAPRPQPQPSPPTVAATRSAPTPTAVVVAEPYQQQMNPEEYNFDEKDDIQVTTKDTTYTLSAKDYYYNNDTLFATSLKVVDKNDHKVKYKITTEIPVKDIEKLEIEKTDVTATIGILLGVVVIIAGVIVIIAIADYSGHI